MVVPTKLSYDTFKKFTNNVYYLPQLYMGEIYEPCIRNDWWVKLLFVWRISCVYKNISFLLDNYLTLKKRFSQLSLTLVWSLDEPEVVERYKDAFENGDITYLWSLPYDELPAIYNAHDIFILPSVSDPIGAVVQEAMAHWCTVLVSDWVWASCYVEDGVSWYVFQSNDALDFQEKVITFIEDTHHLTNCKRAAPEHIRKYYYVGNQSLCARISSEISLFFAQ